MKNLNGGFCNEKLRYTYSLFKGNYGMGSQVIEYRTILLHKYKVEQIVIFLPTNYKNIWLDRTFTFS